MLEAITALALTSTAFGRDGAIPATCTCRDRDISVPLAWGEPPKGTPDKQRVERAMKGHVLAKHEFVGTFADRARPRRRGASQPS